MGIQGQCGSGCHRPGASDWKDAPSITLSPATVDLGTVGEKAELGFIVSNTGKSDLQIKRMHGDGLPLHAFLYVSSLAKAVNAEAR